MSKGAQSALILKKWHPKSHAELFCRSLFFGVFSGKFGRIRAKIFRTHKHLLATTPMDITKNNHTKIWIRAYSGVTVLT